MYSTVKYICFIKLKKMIIARQLSRLVNNARVPQSTVELAQEANITRATAFQELRMLERWGVVVRYEVVDGMVFWGKGENEIPL